MLRKQKNLKAMKKKRDLDKNPLENSMLTSPTSLSMKNSFLIKNSNKGFDNYYNTIKRRKGHGSPEVGGFSPTKAKKQARVKGIRPRPRDGHTTVVYKNEMMVFGGDRHHMPFNDLHFLHIEKEFKERAL